MQAGTVENHTHLRTAEDAFVCRLARNNLTTAFVDQVVVLVEVHAVAVLPYMI